MHVPSVSSRSIVRALFGVGTSISDIANYLGIQEETVRCVYSEDLTVSKIDLINRLKQSMVQRALSDTKDSQKAAEYLLNNLSDWQDSVSNSEGMVINITAMPQGSNVPLVAETTIPDAIGFDNLQQISSSEEAAAVDAAS